MKALREFSNLNIWYFLIFIWNKELVVEFNVQKIKSQVWDTHQPKDPLNLPG